MSHSQIWAGKFSVTDEDLDYLTNLLLERETPLDLEALALALIEKRISDASAAIRKRYENVKIFRPAETYKVGQKLLFTALNHATATVKSVRDGNNPDYGAFRVLSVAFDDEPKRPREFACAITFDHPLNHLQDSDVALPGDEEQNAADVIAANHEMIINALRDKLKKSDDLVAVAGKWFSRSLMLELNEGHLNLAEAVLDLSGGGPLTTEEIIEQLGGIGNAPHDLQVYSLNYTMARDKRFDEVGPTGTVLWYLTRLEPAEVSATPPALRYTPVDYDPSLLTPEMVALEAELDDELSPLAPPEEALDEATISLIYPHRRIGTLPLNAKMRRIFPTALRTPRVYVTLVDGQDGEESIGWVVREERYVFGLSKLYRKHRLPVGSFVSVRHGDEPGKIVIDFRSHRPRTEWVKLLTPKNGQPSFDEQKRGIGAEYDELLILGTDDITGVDALAEQTRQQRKPLAALIRSVITELARFSPQATVHAKTIYSAVNVLRRCPPGPILATLISNPDFENVGSHYWKLSER